MGSAARPGLTFARGERFRVVRSKRGDVMLRPDAKDAEDVVVLRRGLEGWWTLEVGDEKWRLKRDGGDWTAKGDPPAELHRRLLGADVLQIGDERYKVRRTSVTDPGGREILRRGSEVRGEYLVRTVEIVASVPAHVVALAVAAFRLPEPRGRSFGPDSSGQTMGDFHSESGY